MTPEQRAHYARRDETVLAVLKPFEMLDAAGWKAYMDVSDYAEIDGALVRKWWDLQGDEQRKIALLSRFYFEQKTGTLLRVLAAVGAVLLKVSTKE